jgi:hypothetical protein
MVTAFRRQWMIHRYLRMQPTYQADAQQQKSAQSFVAGAPLLCVAARLATIP